MAQFPLTGIDHPAVAVGDPDQMVEWYCDILGYKKASRSDGGAWIIEAPDGSYVEVMPRDQSTRPERTTWTPGWSHLALRVSNLDDAITWLDSKDIEWEGPECEAVGGGRLRSFFDPEGNMWQLVER